MDKHLLTLLVEIVKKGVGKLLGEPSWVVVMVLFATITVAIFLLTGILLPPAGILLRPPAKAAWRDSTPFFAEFRHL